MAVNRYPLKLPGGSKEYDFVMAEAYDDLVSALQTILAYNGAAPDAIQKMKAMAAVALERDGSLS